mmetsp:Transcript_13660/g.15877  ORF Transcript_13660/g.15877 Transcript_13660/m.15877 type:complete len:218 (+) Transcript_13660:131-784(+)
MDWEVYPNCTNNDGTYNKPFFKDIKLFDREINASTNQSKVDEMIWMEDCGSTGCLFDILADPNEHNDLLKGEDVDSFKGVHEEMLALLTNLNKNVFRPFRGELSVDACRASINNGGYYGPFVDVHEYYTGPFPKENFEKKIKNAALLQILEAISCDTVQNTIVSTARESFPFFALEMMKNMDKCIDLAFHPNFTPADFGINMDTLEQPVNQHISVVD